MLMILVVRKPQTSCPSPFKRCYDGAYVLFLLPEFIVHINNTPWMDGMPVHVSYSKVDTQYIHFLDSTVCLFFDPFGYSESCLCRVNKNRVRIY